MILTKKQTHTVSYHKLIPTRGAWLEYEMGAKNIFYGKLDRSKKVSLTALLQAFGFDGIEEIKKEIIPNLQENARRNIQKG